MSLIPRDVLALSRDSLHEAIDDESSLNLNNSRQEVSNSRAHVAMLMILNCFGALTVEVSQLLASAG